MLIPEDYAQVNLQFTGTGVPFGAECTFGVFAGIVTSPTAIADAVAASTSDAVLESLYVDEVTLSNIHVKVGPNDTGASTDRVTLQPGTHSGAPGHAGASFLIKKMTNLGGRKGRGRMYLPGIAEESIITGGLMDGAFISAASTVLDDFLEALDTYEIPMQLLHSDATVPTVVVSLVGDSRAATQRRRQRG